MLDGGPTPTLLWLRAAALLALPGCGLVAGLSDFDDRASTATSTSETSSASSTMPTTTSSSGDVGGGGGSGGGSSSSGSTGGGGSATCPEDCPVGACEGTTCRNAMRFFLQAGDLDGTDSDQQVDAMAFAGVDLVISGTFGESIGITENGLATGDGFGDMFVARISPEGTATDARTFSATGVQIGEAIVALPSGDLAIGGAYVSDVAFPPQTGPSSGLAARAYLVRLGSTFLGEALTTFGGTGTGELVDLQFLRAGADGQVLGAGTFNLATTLGGCTIPHEDDGGVDAFFVAAASEDGACAASATMHGVGEQVAGPLLAFGADRYLVSSTVSGETIFGSTLLTVNPVPCVVKTDALLTEAAASFVCLDNLDPASGRALDAVTGESGDVFLAGWDVRGFRQAPTITRVDMGSGVVVWTTQIGNGEEGDFQDATTLIAEHTDGRLRAVVSFSGTIDLGPGLGTVVADGKLDALILELSPAGEILSFRHLGGDGDVNVDALAIGPDDAVCVAGAFERTIDLGATTFTAHAKLDAFVACFDGE